MVVVHVSRVRQTNRVVLLYYYSKNDARAVFTMPCGRNVSLWVGGLDVEANFVPRMSHPRYGNS
jgi:hypothetical protein